MEFLIERPAWFSALEDGGTREDEFGELLSTEWTRTVISSVVSKGAVHLTLELLGAAQPDDRSISFLSFFCLVICHTWVSLIDAIEGMFLERLQQPLSTAPLLLPLCPNDKPLSVQTTKTRTNINQPSQLPTSLPRHTSLQTALRRTNRQEANEMRVRFSSLLPFSISSLPLCICQYFVFLLHSSNNHTDSPLYRSRSNLNLPKKSKKHSIPTRPT